MLTRLLLLSTCAWIVQAQDISKFVLSDDAAKKTLIKNEINVDTAEKIAKACVEFAKKKRIPVLVTRMVMFDICAVLYNRGLKGVS